MLEAGAHEAPRFGSDGNMNTASDGTFDLVSTVHTDDHMSSSCDHAHDSVLNDQTDADEIFWTKVSLTDWTNVRFLGYWEEEAYQNDCEPDDRYWERYPFVREVATDHDKCHRPNSKPTQEGYPIGDDHLEYEIKGVQGQSW